MGAGLARLADAMTFERASPPIGRPLPDWTARARPPAAPLVGRTCRLEPLDPARHGDALYAAYCADGDADRWTYLPYGPFSERAAFDAWLAGLAASTDPMMFALCAPDGRALGQAGLMRIDPNNGVIEIGHVLFGPDLARSVAATEAVGLLLRLIFDGLGYRRCEWKCDDLNAPSRRAAVRFGFSFEGIFRQAIVYKGRNRDTAWYAIVDSEWPALRAAFDAWLDPGNFDADGRQKTPLRP